MNYFAHGRNYTHDPYFLAGTCVPDWLGVIDRRNRARSRVAKTLFEDADPIVVSIARGVAHQFHAKPHQPATINPLKFLKNHFTKGF
jgi:hypothetical protein